MPREAAQEGQAARETGGPAPRVLVVDDQRAMAEMVTDGLADHGFDARFALTAEEATLAIDERNYDVLVTDLRIPGTDGLELLALSRAKSPASPVIVMTAFSAVDTAIESIRRGAYHYVTKPFRVEELALFIRRALEESALRHEARALRKALRSTLDNVIGDSAAMREVFDLIRRVADSSAPVLLLGETGTGKSLLARAIHVESARSAAPFVTVNCSAIPENLLESELFGHVRGAFTGATDARLGLFAEANGGTLFLDEIGEMSLPLQAKLLHVLEVGRVRPVGSDKDRKVDVRIVAATNRHLRSSVAAGLFREDLLYRLDVIAVDVPPLRRRKEDIPRLAAHFLAAAQSRHPKATLRRLSRDVMDALLAYAWPGNVRELEHVIERITLLCPGEQAALADLPKNLTSPAGAANPARAADMAFGDEVLPIREIQRRYASWALQKLGGAKMATCEALGIDSKTLAKWLKEPEG
ncbi:sigma-54-dependent transcriptional regulator [Pendulispora albinea]|uniref:Sigma-54 dependent transcriptional regulator n=1 Tax=Pendulispora albinea TaxID=2741071 RepID=A0ABZ2LRH5_9BACT